MKLTYVIRQGRKGRHRIYFNEEGKSVLSSLPVAGYDTHKEAEAFAERVTESLREPKVRVQYEEKIVPQEVPMTHQPRFWVIIVTVAALGVLVGTMTAANAHPGRVSKDGCHRESATGTVHWHTTKAAVGGRCIRTKGQPTIHERVVLKEVAKPILKLVEECPIKREYPAICEDLTDAYRSEWDKNAAFERLKQAGCL